MWCGWVLAALLLTPGLSHSADKPLLDSFRVERVKVSRDPAISLHVEPRELQQSGSYVTVNFTGVVDPQPSDLVAAYCPPQTSANATAPFKFQYAQASPDYLKSGQGTIRFRLLNLRDDVVFRFLRGDINDPVVVATSQYVSFSAPNEVMGVHLALADSSGPDMRVTWTSRDKASPQVMVREWGGEWRTIQAQTTTFGRADLCGPPATTVGFMDPHSVHSALLSGLQYDTTYQYMVGDPVLNEWSTVTTFSTAPAIGSSQPMRVAIFGDLGCAEVDQTIDPGKSNEVASLNTMGLISQQLEGSGGLDLVVHIGDISYASGYLSQWIEFLEQIRPVATRIPWMVGTGNHERGSPAGSVSRLASSSLFINSDSGGECGWPYQAYFPMPGPALDPRADTPWYSFDHGPVHYTVISSEHDFRPGSSQYTFILEDLSAVDRDVTPWLLLLSHRPFYVSSTDDTRRDSDQGGAWLLRQSLEEALLSHKVDMVLAGHMHSYQRTCQVSRGVCVATAEAAGPRLAPVHAILGMAGRPLETDKLVYPAPAIFEYTNGLDYGLTVMEVDRTSLRLLYYADRNASLLLDSFTIYKEGEGGEAALLLSAANHGMGASAHSSRRASSSFSSTSKRYHRFSSTSSIAASGVGGDLNGAASPLLVPYSSFSSELLWLLLASLFVLALIMGLLMGHRPSSSSSWSPSSSSLSSKSRPWQSTMLLELLLARLERVERRPLLSRHDHHHHHPTHHPGTGRSGGGRSHVEGREQQPPEDAPPIKAHRVGY